MKKIIFFIVMVTCSMLSFAQANYGKYSLPHTTDLAKLNQYIGQKVKVMDYEGYGGVYSSYDGHDESVFKTYMKGVIGKEYTIQKVKVGKQIILELADDNEDIIKANLLAELI